METVALHGPRLGVGRLCRALALPRATYYRHLEAKAPPPRPTPARALTVAERQTVLDVLHEPRFVDQAPAEIYARLLDEKRYLCSERTMYRVLADNAEVRERRDQLRHPAYKKPELLATAPNQVWSWDITKLLGPAKWTYFYLYVMLDIFSRYVVGWMVAHRESATLARKLIEETCQRQGIAPGQLAIHADRGPSMTSKTIAQLYADLGVTQSHSRPNVSNDNPFSEAQFKTLKYRPDFPGRFGSAQHVRAHCGSILRLVQLRAPPRRHRPAHAARRPLRPRRSACRGASSGARRRACRASRALPRWRAHAAAGAHRCLDQPTHADVGGRRGGSLNSNQRCLILVDRFRRRYRRWASCRRDGSRGERLEAPSCERYPTRR